MKASEAKRKADEISNSRDTIEYRKIMQLIETAVNRGDYSTKITTLSTNVGRLLREDGYEVNYYSDQRDSESYYIIRWSKS